MTKKLILGSISLAMIVMLMTFCGISHHKIRYGNKQVQSVRTTKADTRLNELMDINLLSELEKVTDLNQIMSFGVMMTPALVVNGKVKVSGKVPNVNELKSLLQSAA